MIVNPLTDHTHCKENIWNCNYSFEYYIQGSLARNTKGADQKIVYEFGIIRVEIWLKKMFQLSTESSLGINLLPVRIAQLKDADGAPII